MSAQHDIDSPENIARRQHGQQVLARIDGEQGEAVLDSLGETSPALAHHIAAFAFGDVYERPGLDARSRQLVTLGALTALGGCEPQLQVHVNAALNVGITREQITEALLHAAVYAGFPRAINATGAAEKVFQQREAAAAAITPS
ncbi:carboxymuconolactone decarboxylase family protein [Gephyromycinifex aptenodytis]|uniref:carboxymuconolactone decarboxylase family protein n=1 Tax=Gephyromycinifex aptenodytis TaxID=2716227 RepID=UPI0014478F7A|nr:carboxymuconolactone decarboxylase family protein [Gephyromycinifex aptenodytis]